MQTFVTKHVKEDRFTNKAEARAIAERYAPSIEQYRKDHNYGETNKNNVFLSNGKNMGSKSYYYRYPHYQRYCALNESEKLRTFFCTKNRNTNQLWECSYQGLFTFTHDIRTGHLVEINKIPFKTFNDQNRGDRPNIFL